MRYILINIIVLFSFLGADEIGNTIDTKHRAFIVLKPISIEYNIIKKEEINEIVQEENSSEGIDDENIVNMWANPSLANEDEEIQNEKIENNENNETQNSSNRCKTILTGFTVDKEGCPQTYQLKTKFKNKSFQTVPKMSEELKEFSEFLKKHTSYQVVIYSYTDSIGEEIPNKELTTERATVIKKILMKLGVSSTKLTAIGQGEKEPLDSNMYKAGRDKNNRIEIELIY